MGVKNTVYSAFLAALMLVQPAIAEDIISDASNGVVEVRVEGVSSSKGTVYASIFLSAEGFPGDKDMAYDYRAAPAQNGSVVLTFDQVPAGKFVVAVLHDADSNEEMSFNLLGMPKEDYGFSRDARAKFGPPKFDKAAVSLQAGENKQLTVRVTKI
ncbi:MAG: DUF2141 domain-containing protein [Gammaproteobacteria bacterium]